MRNNTPTGLNSQPLLQGQETSSDDMNSQLSVDDNEILSLDTLAPNAASIMAQGTTDFTTEHIHQHSNVNTPVNLNREILSDVDMACDSDTISPNATEASIVGDWRSLSNHKYPPQTNHLINCKMCIKIKLQM